MHVPRKQPVHKAPDLHKIADRSAEVKYYGLHACMKLWQSRPADVIRVYLEERHLSVVAPLLKWCVSHRKAYHVVSEEELVRITSSTHHEGLCVLAKEPPEMSFNAILERVSHPRAQTLLYIDGVQNPHNIGSIMRVCAHFNVSYILGAKNTLPKVSPSAYRIAQGGAEYVQLVPIDNVDAAFVKLVRAGFQIVATSSHGGISLYEHTFAPKTLIIIGAEGTGVQRRLLKTATSTLRIPGTKAVESLNVSVATGLLLGECWRQHGDSQ
jgi:TrmH RNA methyltransferase